MEFGFWDGIKLGVDLFWSIISSEPTITISLTVIFVGAYILSFTARILKEQKLKKSGILEIDKMSGRMFEEYLQVLMKSRGYYTNLTPASGDYGADLVLSTKNSKIIVQAKRYKKNVGVKAVQEIASAKSYYSADECWVVTNSYFTEQAKKLAVSNKVRLIDRDELMKWMLENVHDTAG